GTFQQEQEAGFRARESRCLRAVLAEDGRVVAVGGGAPLDEANWQAIRAGNWVVALTTSPAELKVRLREATDRPLLRPSVGAAIDSLLPARIGRYREADLVVSTDGRSPAAVATAIADALPHDGMERIAVDVHGFPHEIVVGSGLCHLLPAVLARASVQGPVAGFAAATRMRGTPYVQVPTTLLAMVDSSIGGKPAVNLPAGKNLVGAVHQPVAIICDLDYLKTLPEGEYRAAWGEIIKCAVAGDRQLFDDLRAARSAALGREEPVVRRIVARAAAFKARIVAEDPHDRNGRAVLNYGHTVAHA